MCNVHAGLTAPGEADRAAEKHGKQCRHWALVEEEALEEGPPAAALLVVRLKLRGLLAYLGRGDVSAAERLRVTRLIFRGVTTVSQLIQAQKSLVEMALLPGTAGCAGQLLDRIIEES